MNEETKPTEEINIWCFFGSLCLYQDGVLLEQIEHSDMLSSQSIPVVLLSDHQALCSRLQKEKEELGKHATYANEVACRWEARAEAAERELTTLKRGEFICHKCGLRKDDEHEPAEF